MKLFRRLLAPKPPVFQAPIAPGQPFYAIGDIHGRDDLLERMLQRIARNASSDTPVILVGDYVDRGEQSAEVLRRLQALTVNQADQGEANGTPCMTCLMGNHEKMLLNFLDNPESTGSRWARYGGLQTMASFGLGYISEQAPEEQWLEQRDQLREAMGPALEAWLRALPLVWRSGNVTVLHAAADPARSIEAQETQALLWGHPDFETHPRSDGQWIVHGHTIIDQPACRQGRISIDTGAYATGHLTAALVSPGGVDFFSS